MFWFNKKNKEVNNIRGFNVFINEEKQAIMNIIKLNLSRRICDKELLKEAIDIGLQIMEETVTHQATYLKEVDGVIYKFKIK